MARRDGLAGSPDDVGPVMALGARRSNAELMRDCRRLGYLDDGWRVLDATFGLGRFWSLWRPAGLVTNDLVTEADHAFDFRALGWSDREFDAVVFDPPYKLNGTPGGGGAAVSDVGYGVGVRASWRERHELIRAGIAECGRVADRMLLVKCQDQVCAGRKRWQTREFADCAEGLGFRLVDMLHVGGFRVQPRGREQVHARQDFSTLLVLRRVGG